ncbi:Myb-like DNA-binding domain containing protein [Trichomonas vaginalis G3]|uniref:Myb-like DNA-binding domain containing protein n=1 Tax=Trichomonas vaginalis (strain ATCC PRA-98 / G3) TaxID=412133 RepID=A2DAT0_TRIV3|nr:RNA polymerase II transcription regulator recruiting protein [Trichomonas vaginalis G3]EAY22583.1 Myb-like DNA-binding domain containing protein [Trichomonas vaginalis G3]KAI5497315.1 RNA polymerase II transcription regulator recruiting protein [Trichomonas vaginalis G3]|eukprot:XP_001583569.1 Myb-like DNA-binding domain containing protein [Trichomonas vaginalis G3]
MSKRVIHRFSKEEDNMIIDEVKKHDDNIKWAIDMLVNKLKENHSRRAILERFKSFLSQSRGEWTTEEDKRILEYHNKFGNRWSLISKYFKNRSGDQIKIRYNQLTKKNESSTVIENQNIENNTIPSCDNSIWEELFEMEEEQIEKMFA